MKNKLFQIIGLLLCLMTFTTVLHAQSAKVLKAKISIDINKPGHTISPTLFGIFFEDINLSTDGGIYPELVRNRSFEDADTLQNWNFLSVDGKSSALICTADVQSRPGVPPLNAFNRKSLCIKANGSFKLENVGYFGMNIVQGDSYSFKLAARAIDGFRSSLKIKIIGSNGNELSSGEINDINAGWKYYPLSLKASGSDPKAHLEISGQGDGRLYLDMVSLMPDKTWKNHGLRIDLSEAIDALHPTFLRFPGGCWVEGDDFEHMNHWKNTIGNIDTRTPLWNIWGYNATHGLGYHEYLQLAEDLGAEPLYCINAGVSHKEIVPMDRMGQWIQDALDAIEYANGSVSSVWGSIRAKNGHSKPFNLKYMEIGNENGGPDYNERYELIAKAILAKYPDMKLIANEWYNNHPQNPKPEIIDEHYYDNPDWFIWNANKYDSYDRNGPKIFIGEYAVTSGSGNGNLRGAIGEAAWMTGMERNSDIVAMGSYAPLYCNSNHKRWPINLINFDSHRWFGIPSYYVQEMFLNNQGTVTIPVTIESAPGVEIPITKGGIGFGTQNSVAEFKDLHVVSSKGKVLLKSDFSKIDEKWRKSPRSEWSVKGGILRPIQLTQPSNTFDGGGSSIFMGDTTWTDYTVILKARKISGKNGFQLYFRNRDGGGRTCWDIGGSGGTTCSIEYGLLSDSKKINIENGRWYDIKLEIRDNTIKGYIDGKLVQEVSDANVKVKCINVCAAKDDKSGDIILKIVNTSSSPVKTQVDLKSAGMPTGRGKSIVLTSASSSDENTLEKPTKVSPKTENFKFSGFIITRSLPGNSLTILRLLTSNKK